MIVKEIKKLPEILAPAGNWAALKAAVYNGADAVYLGLSGGFNARAKAGNFDFLQLSEAIEFAHLFGVRVYIAMNTLVKDSETERAVASILQAGDLGADAFILQDLGLLSELRRQGFRAEFHASTQLGIHNAEGAIAAQKMGFRRIILSRETTADDIKKIHAATDLEIEYFVHGALCVSFSGNCYYSSLLAGESGNRGRCLQLCRKQYLLNDESGKILAEGHLLSLKDLNLSARLKELADAGVCSFKIEGRLRRPEYVGETVRIYKKALCEPISRRDNDRLKIMFNRGEGCEGYFSEPTPVLIHPHHPAHIGLLIGYVERAEKTVSVQYLKDAPTLKKGDGIKFMRNGKETGAALIENPRTITFAGNVSAGDEVRITSQSELNEEVLSRRRAIFLSATVDIAVGSPARYVLTDGETVVESFSSGPVQASVAAPLTADKLTFLFKTGDESIVMSDKTLNLGEKCFLSVSELKQLRRTAVAQWRAEKLKAYKNSHRSIISIATECFASTKFYHAEGKRTVFVMIGDADAVTDRLLDMCDCIVLSPAEYTIEAAKKFAIKAGKKAALNLPNIARGNDVEILHEIILQSGIEIFIVNNLYGLELCAGKNVILGAGMNCLNRLYGDNVFRVASIESEKPQRGTNILNLVYGRAALMTVSFCPQKSFCKAGCGSCGRKEFVLTDDRNTRFPLSKKKIANCYYELCNSLPMDNREVIGYCDCGVMVDLTGEKQPFDKLTELTTQAHASYPHTHGNYKRELK